MSKATQTPTPSIQDFSLVNSFVEKYKKDYGFKDSSNAFYYLVLGHLLNLQDDEITDSITDNHFLKTIGKVHGHDRGIDAVYIDESDTKPTVHFFNFKYIQSFEKVDGFFPSAEIDKIVGFLNSVMQMSKGLKDEVNPMLYSKIEEIWNIFQTQNPNFEIHICANLYRGLEPLERERFEREVRRHSNLTVFYHLMPDLVALIRHSGKTIINGRIKAIDKNFFEKSGGDIRALIVHVDARDLIRLVLDNAEIRNNVDLDDYDVLKDYNILEDTFEDNVRKYLKQRSKINKSIKNTALSEDNHRFFYYNNGITLTCKSFKYQPRRGTIIELEDVQIVNGGQTIHALYEAFKADSSKFDQIELLCRIYETQDLALSTKIAEYTNSQNPVKSRDIRSIDSTQQDLETQLRIRYDYYYERKRNQHSNQPKEKRLDSEKIGQLLLTFFNNMPNEAKNKKSIIFAEKYDEVFNDSITADDIHLTHKLFERIEEKKNEKKTLINSNLDLFDSESYILHASYYILYLLGQLAQKVTGDKSLSSTSLEEIWALYDSAIKILEEFIEKERGLLKEKYSHAAFFKTNKPKKYFEDLSNDELKKLTGLAIKK
ncbi:MAG: AIPR family protein [Ardenticatenales bacterium]|nr:AIPR family protein [Ardenticatenales bacterium]